jgi:cell division protein FtsI (penicillin-binding protein 3)
MTGRKPQSGRVERAASGTWTRRRSLFLAGMLALWIVGLVARLYQLEVISYAELLSRAQRQQQRTIEVAPQRGTIYDRLMQPLAMSLAVDSVYAVPSEMPDRHLEAKLLASALKLDRQDLEGQFQTFKTFCWVKRKVTSQEGERVRGLDLKGVYFQKEMKRFYPKGSLGAQVLGYAGMDDKGLAGLEYSLDKEIRGTPGRVLVDTDARRKSFHSTEWQGEPGDNVVLTLDENIQYIAERALDAAVKKWKAADGIVIVQNPNTGEILAMASSPTFDPNHYAKSKPSDWINRAVGWIYEPGSTFKIVTVSAALQEGLARPSDVIDCQMGAIVLAGHTIHDHKPYGDLTVEQVLVNSSDVGAIKLGLRLGSDRLYRYIRSFGFGSDTDIRLPGEERGLLKPPDRWSGISVGEISMGQEVGVTPLQMVSAYSAIANGGMLMRPSIVHDVYRGDRHELIPPAPGRRIVSQHTADQMRRMFEKVVEEGTGMPARIPGYTVGGKTGTAQKIDASGTYSKTHYIASFIGFAPVSRPAITVLVVIDSPVGAIYGTEVAAPVFKSITEQTLGYLNVPQDNPSWWPQLASSAAGSSRQKREGRVAFLPTGPEPSRAATSAVQRVSFRPPSDKTAQSTVVLNDGPLTPVPDFSGLSVRRAAEECQALGLDLSFEGSGLAVQQSPHAGTQVAAGTRVWLKFAR